MGFVQESHQSVALEQTEITEGKRMKSVVVKKGKKKKKKLRRSLCLKGVYHLISERNHKPNWTEKFIGLSRMPVGGL